MTKKELLDRSCKFAADNPEWTAFGNGADFIELISYQDSAHMTKSEKHPLLCLKYILTIDIIDKEIRGFVLIENGIGYSPPSSILEDITLCMGKYPYLLSNYLADDFKVKTFSVLFAARTNATAYLEYVRPRLNNINGFGDTELHKLAKNLYTFKTEETEDVIIKLIELGSDLSIINNDGETALDVLRNNYPVEAGKLISSIEKIMLEKDINQNNGISLGL